MDSAVEEGSRLLGQVQQIAEVVTLLHGGRTVVDAEPGSYRVAISPSKSDRRYALLVEECGVPEVT